MIIKFRRNIIDLKMTISRKWFKIRWRLNKRQKVAKSLHDNRCFYFYENFYRLLDIEKLDFSKLIYCYKSGWEKCFNYIDVTAFFIKKKTVYIYNI